MQADQGARKLDHLARYSTCPYLFWEPGAVSSAPPPWWPFSVCCGTSFSYSTLPLLVDELSILPVMHAFQHAVDGTGTQGYDHTSASTSSLTEPQLTVSW